MQIDLVVYNSVSWTLMCTEITQRSYFYSEILKDVGKHWKPHFSKMLQADANEGSSEITNWEENLWNIKDFLKMNPRWNLLKVEISSVRETVYGTFMKY